MRLKKVLVNLVLVLFHTNETYMSVIQTVDTMGCGGQWTLHAQNISYIEELRNIWSFHCLRRTFALFPSSISICMPS